MNKFLMSYAYLIRAVKQSEKEGNMSNVRSVPEIFLCSKDFLLRGSQSGYK